jgi:lipopolysaccharide transport system permease protein
LDASESLVASSNLVSKVYFPRLAIPIATVGSHLIDLGIGLTILAGAAVYYGTGLGVRLLVVALMCVLLFVSAAALGIGLAAINVRYRDVRYAVPFLVQVLLFVSPVAYSSAEVGHPAILLYALNPMAGVIEGFRWGVLDVPRDPTDVILVSSASALILLAASLAYFTRVEKTFADVI